MIEIIVSVITGVFTLLGVVITVIYANKKTTIEIEKQQAVFNTQLCELTREVREHNGFARRIPVVEEQIKVICHRLETVERKVD